MAQDINPFARRLRRLQFIDQPGQLATRVNGHGILIHPVVLYIVQIRINRNDAQVRVPILDRVRTETRLLRRSRGPNPPRPVGGKEFVQPVGAIAHPDRREGVERRHLVVANGAIYRKPEAGHARVRVVDVQRVLCLRCIPHGVVDYVAREERECIARRDFFDGGVHALFQADGGVASMIAIGTGGRVVVSGGVAGLVRAAAYGLSAIGVCSCLIGLVDVDVTELEHLERRLATR